LPAGWSLSVYEIVDSTNAEARRRAEAGATHGAVIQAITQSAGRGRYRRPWVSEAGNLYCSVILRPDCPVAQAGQLSFVVALAGAAAIEDLSPGCSVRVKWPNDLLLGRSKIAGILLESSLDAAGRAAWVVAGIGVNLVSHPAGTVSPATDLAAAGAGEIGSLALLERYLERLAGLEAEWRATGFAALRLAWLDRAVGLGEVVTIRGAKDTRTGRFEDLDKEGGLVLRREDGATETVTAGDVFFGDSPCS
jgi:BirA family biotin operon repressor/biotin-[acetyl-CoA-carboxylase] ligase